MKHLFGKLHSTGLLALILFAVFSVSILSVLTTGIDVYKRIVDRDDASYTQRTVERYLSARIRQSSAPEEISVTPFGDGDGLWLHESIEGYPFVTCIYCHNGNLMELFTSADYEPAPEDGEIVLPLTSLKGDCKDGLLTLTLTESNGTEQTLFLSLRTSREVTQ